MKNLCTRRNFATNPLQQPYITLKFIGLFYQLIQMVGEKDFKRTEVSAVIEHIHKFLTWREDSTDAVKELLTSKGHDLLDPYSKPGMQLLRIMEIIYGTGYEDGKERSGQAGLSPSQMSLGLFLKKKISDRKIISEDYVMKVAPVMRAIRANYPGVTLMEMATRLTEMKIKTPLGYSRWYPSTVRQVEKKITTRLAELEDLLSRIQSEAAAIQGISVASASA